MGAKVAEGAENGMRGSQLQTGVDHGDYGTHAKIISDNATQVRGKAPTGTPENGTQVQSAEFKDEQYTLTSPARVATFEALNKINPKAAALFELLAEDATNLGVPMGGKPDDVSAGEQIQEDGEAAAPTPEVAPEPADQATQVKLQDAIKEKDQQLTIDKAVNDELNKVLDEVTGRKHTAEGGKGRYPGGVNPPKWVPQSMREIWRAALEHYIADGGDVHSPDIYKQVVPVYKGLLQQYAPDAPISQTSGGTPHYGPPPSKDVEKAMSDLRAMQPTQGSKTAAAQDDAAISKGNTKTLESPATGSVAPGSADPSAPRKLHEAMVKAFRALDAALKSLHPRLSATAQRGIGYSVESLRDQLASVGNVLRSCAQATERTPQLERQQRDATVTATQLVDQAQRQMQLIQALATEVAVHGSRFEQIAPAIHLGVYQVRAGQIGLPDLPIKTAEYLRLSQPEFQAVEKVVRDLKGPPQAKMASVDDDLVGLFDE